MDDGAAVFGPGRSPPVDCPYHVVLMPPAAADRPIRADGLEINEVDDGLVLYQPWPGQVHYLNNTAAFVFELCSGEHTIVEIAASMANAFSMPTQPIDSVVQCVGELRAKGVLT